MNEESLYAAGDLNTDIELVEEIFGKEEFRCPVCGAMSTNGSWKMIKSDCLLMVYVSHEVLDSKGCKAEHPLIYVGAGRGNISINRDMKKRHAKQFKAYKHINF